MRLFQVEEQKSVGMILVMEICDCDLEDYLKKNQISERQFRRYCCDYSSLSNDVILKIDFSSN